MAGTAFGKFVPRVTAIALLNILLVWSVWGVWGRAAAADLPPNGQPVSDQHGPERAIMARGRLEPKDGVMKVAGPSQPTIFINVISELRVKEGDSVQAGQIVALFDSYDSKRTQVERLRAELALAEREYGRFQELYRSGVASAEERDTFRTKVDVTKAQLQHAEADLELAVVRAPIRGKVLKIHAHPGERVGVDGVAELGNTDEMYAIAEVYETDITQVHVGQRANVSSPALGDGLQGTVEHIGWKVGKMDVLDADPAAKADARVVEVKIRLDDSGRVAHLTYMQVDVRIIP